MTKELNVIEGALESAQHKLENGKFSDDDMKWHCQHNEKIGYHRGMWRVLKEIAALNAVLEKAEKEVG